MRVGDQRTHFCRRIGAVADLERLGLRNQFFEQRTAASPTGTRMLPARQRSPAAPNAELMIASTDLSMSASAITTR
jgi:hypothetical protein